VLYDGGLFDDLARRFGSLTPVDQLGLLDDAWALGVAGYAPAPGVLRLARALPADANPIVWQRIVERLDELDKHYADGRAKVAFRRFALALLAPLAARLGPTGPESEPSNRAILRGALDQARGKLGDAAVVTLARRRFETGDGTPQERRTALAVTASHADARTFEDLLGRATRATDPLEKQRFLQALAGVTDPALARRMVDVALSDVVPAGSGRQILEILAREHPDMVWETVAPRLDDPGLPFDPSERWSLAGTIAGESSDPRRVADLEAYEARSVPAEVRKPFLTAISAVRRNERFRSTVLPELDAWIRGRDRAR